MQVIVLVALVMDILLWTVVGLGIALSALYRNQRKASLRVLTQEQQASSTQ